jgi:hypothetical protein
MTLHTVTFTDATEVEVYMGLTALDAAMFTSGSAGAAAYRALTAGSDDRKRLLVDVTRYIDSLDWIGEANGADGTTLEFPRTGEGTALDDYTDAEQLALVNKAVAELVAIAATNRAALDALDASSNVKIADVSGAKVEFWAPTSIEDGTATQMPVPAQRYLGRFLSGSGAPGVVVSVAGSSSYSSCGSNFERRDALRRRDPF